ncbi:MAG: glycogen-binding domain-containing protein, partial [Gemmatimonadaceae bacterium]|nr:glycogen-binding domain-containing protein [Gemmatimonadaceae bacterium]
RTGTALEREPGTGRWSVVLQLAPGRYRYAFLVDGATWRADPAQELVRDADFGVPTSEVVVGVQP